DELFRPIEVFNTSIVTEGPYETRQKRRERNQVSVRFVQTLKGYFSRNIKDGQWFEWYTGDALFMSDTYAGSGLYPPNIAIFQHPPLYSVENFSNGELIGTLQYFYMDGQQSSINFDDPESD